MTLEELRAEAALKANDDNELERALNALKEYRDNHTEEFTYDTEDDILEEEEFEIDEVYEYDYDVDYKSWEERAWEDSGMTWADFIEL